MKSEPLNPSAWELSDSPPESDRLYDFGVPLGYVDPESGDYYATVHGMKFAGNAEEWIGLRRSGVLRSQSSQGPAPSECPPSRVFDLLKVVGGRTEAQVRAFGRYFDRIRKIERDIQLDSLGAAIQELSQELTPRFVEGD